MTGDLWSKTACSGGESNPVNDSLCGLTDNKLISGCLSFLKKTSADEQYPIFTVSKIQFLVLFMMCKKQICSETLFSSEVTRRVLPVSGRKFFHYRL